MLYISGSFYYYIEKVTEECWEVWSMKIKIEIDEALEEDVVLIQCSDRGNQRSPKGSK